jgi:hypothetical protein
MGLAAARTFSKDDTIICLDFLLLMMEDWFGLVDVATMMAGGEQ